MCLFSSDADKQTDYGYHAPFSVGLAGVRRQITWFRARCKFGQRRVPNFFAITGLFQLLGKNNYIFGIIS